MRILERIFLYTVIAILIFHVFLVDDKAESQVNFQEGLVTKRIAIVDDAGREIILLDKDGTIAIRNKDGTYVAGIFVDEDGEGVILITNKEGNPVITMEPNEDSGSISVFNGYGQIIETIP